MNLIALAKERWKKRALKEAAYMEELLKPQCPDCGSKRLLAGPEGGCCQNVLCQDCNSEFNFGPGGYRERIGEKNRGRTSLYLGGS